MGVKKAEDFIKMRNGKKKWTPSMKAKLTEYETPFDILYPCKHHFSDLYDNPRNYGIQHIEKIVNVEEVGKYAIIGKMIHVDDVDVNDVQSIAKRGGEILDGPHMKVHVRLEDDTGVMMCILNRFAYEQMAHEFLREKIGDTWYCVIGHVKRGAKILYIEEVANLNKQVGLNETKEVRLT